MSEDGSPAGGHLHLHLPQQNQEHGENSSIIEKVKTRVSSIMPQTFSKWFSPTRPSRRDSTQVVTGDMNRNGKNIRRRRNDLNYDHGPNRNEADPDDSGDSDEDAPESGRPPAKKSRLNVTEEYSTSYSVQSSFNTANSFVASTPAPIGYKKFEHVPTWQTKNSDFMSRTLDSKSLIPSRMHATLDSDVLEMIPERHPLPWDFEGKTCSRRSLNIPSKTSAQVVGGPSRHLSSMRHIFQKKFKSDDRSSSQPIVGRNAIEDDEDDQPLDAVNSEKRNRANGSDRTSPNTVINLDTASESGESQCSSLPPRRATNLFGSGINKCMRTSFGSSLNFAAHLQGERSLFSDKNMPNALNNSTTSLTSLDRRQRFNASLYGSTSALSDSRLLNTSSLFYDGRTTFGGASAYRKYGQPRRGMLVPTQIRPSSSLSTLSSNSNSYNLSHTAKRILDLINQCTTPVGDAKKMVNCSINASSNLLNRTDVSELPIKQSVRVTVSNSPYGRSQSSLPKHDLRVPSMSQLLQMKKLQNNTERVREIAVSANTVLNRQEYTLPAHKPAATEPAKHTNKMKMKKASARISAKNQAAIEETAAPVNLPNIALPMMKSVPKIDINFSSSVPAPVSASATRTTLSNSKPSKQATEAKENSASSIGSSSTVSPEKMKTFTVTTNGYPTPEFTFSEPKQVAANTSHNLEPMNNFIFRDPVFLNTTAQKTLEFGFNENVMKATIFNSAPTSIAATWSPPTTVPQLKTGSVLDALKTYIVEDDTKIGEPESTTNAAMASFGDTFKLPSDKWECDVCMIRNNNTSEKCVACETPKKAKSATSMALSEYQPAIAVTNTIGEQFKPTTDTWECPTCMIRNKSELSKCAACETSKPGERLATTKANFITADDGFKNIVAQQNAQWECSACMTRNEKSRRKCLCCGQAKPGDASENVPQFNFGTKSSKFTFGFGGAKEEELKTNESSNLLLPKSNETLKSSGFNFGLPSTSSTETANVMGTSAFIFGVTPTTESTAKTTESSETKKDAVPPVTTQTFSFGTPDAIKKPEIVPISSAELSGFKSPNVAQTTSQTLKTVEKCQSSDSAIIEKRKDEAESTNAQSKIATVFSPIGGFAFGAKDAKPAASFTFGTTSKSEASSSKTATTKVDTPLASTASSKLSFGSSERPELSFVAPSASATPTQQLIFGPPQIIPTQASSVTSTTQFKPVFGQSSSSALLSFGAANAHPVTTANVSAPTTSTPTFGGVGSVVSSPSIPSFGSTAGALGASLKAPNASAPAFGNAVVPVFGSASSDSQAKNYLFGTAAPSPSVESKVPTFGSNASVGTASKPFSFGVSKPNESSAIGSSTTTPFVFGSSTTQKAAELAPTFGSTLNSGVSTFSSFNNLQQSQQQQQPQQLQAFGQMSAPNLKPFGSAVTTNNVVPVFGATNSNHAPVFGAASGGFSATSLATFGSVGNSNLFGSSSNSAVPVFGTNMFGTGEAGISQTDGPAAKKTTAAFDFGAAAPAQSNTVGRFNFSSNNNNNNTNKPAFSFSAPNQTTSFNFTGSQEPPTTSQPFMFGAAAPTAPAVFNFSGTETTSNAPFQFNANNNNNPFAPIIGAPSTTQQPTARRKIRNIPVARRGNR